MTKQYQIGDAIIDVTEEGKVTYAVGKRKTTFNLSDCQAITYNYLEGRVTITEELLNNTSEIESWLWLVIIEGENRLEYNNNQRETRKHNSYSDYSDKYDTLASDENIPDKILQILEIKNLREAIKKLDPQQQKLIQDIYYSELSKADIARRDGVNKSSITKRISRIIEKLKKYFKNL